MSPATDALLKIPRNAPLWSAGVVSILASFALCFGSMYIVIRPEVQSYLTENYKVQGKKADSEAVMISNILSIMKANSEQIASLSSSLALSQSENARLTMRVEVVERELATTKLIIQGYETRFKELRRP